jgi:hypothetical protein
MFVALSMMGWFMYLDAKYTPLGVVICVIIYNAFFGYSWVRGRRVVFPLAVCIPADF